MDPSTRSILEARARALARRPDAQDPSDAISVIVLVVAGERYGIDAAYVQEVGIIETLTAVPGLPPAWAGLVNVRGRILPVLDLRVHLGLETSDTQVREVPRLVFVSDGDVTVAVLSDAAPELRRVRTESIVAPIGATTAKGVVTGITPDFLSILDMETVLNDASAGARSIGG